MAVLILLAIAMALAGVLGYRRGPKSSLVTGVILWVAMLAIARQGPGILKLVKIVRAIVSFITKGGVQALADGSGNLGALAAVSSLSDEDNATILMAFFLVVTVAAFWIGAIKSLVRGPSGWGLFLGLLNGCAPAVFVLGRLVPEMMAGVPLAELSRPGTAPPVAAVGTGPAVGAKLAEWINLTGDKGTLTLIVVVSIALFVLFATRFTNRPAKSK